MYPCRLKRRARLVSRNKTARYIHGVLTAGTFYQRGQRVFWDVPNPDNTIVIELRDEQYNELIVEVADPAAAVELIEGAKAAR